jgi:hypothetical protein
MRSSHSITAWLFEHLGLDAALAGDLLENARADVSRSGIGDRS